MLGGMGLCVDSKRESRDRRKEATLFLA